MESQWPEAGKQTRRNRIEFHFHNDIDAHTWTWAVAWNMHYEAMIIVINWMVREAPSQCVPLAIPFRIEFSLMAKLNRTWRCLEFYIHGRNFSFCTDSGFMLCYVSLECVDLFKMFLCGVDHFLRTRKISPQSPTEFLMPTTSKPLNGQQCDEMTPAVEHKCVISNGIFWYLDSAIKISYFYHVTS